MSSKRPSAFDVLLANSSKKKKQLSKNKEPCISSTSYVPQEIIPYRKKTEIHFNRLNPNSKQFNEAQIVNAPGHENVAAKAVSISPSESVEELKKKAATFDPTKAGYWGKGVRVPFMFLAKAFDAISMEKGSILITDIVCNLLRTVIETTPEDLVPVVYLLDKRIAPASDGLKLGIGDATIIKVLAGAFGASEDSIDKQRKELSGLGNVAKVRRSSQPLLRKPEALTVTKVFDTLHVIAKESGKYSQEKRNNYMKGLLVAATDCEPQYLISILQGNLRIGLGEETLLTALGHAAYYSQKHSFPPPKDVDSPLDTAAKILKQAYSAFPVYENIIRALLAHGLWELPKTCSLTPGVPVRPMLSKHTKGVSEILDKFQDTVFTCEYKYDGERAQIHFLENGSVGICSRNGEWSTGKYPDVVAAIKRLKESSVTSFVLDCELVAYDREKKKILPFQALGTRARKFVALEDIKIDVCIYAFDILYLDGQSLLTEQLDVRRQLLYKSFKEEPGFFQFATAITTNDLEVMQKFLESAVDASCEGLIIKRLEKDATYELNKRNWLKLKKDYMDSLGDTLDLVPIAAFHGLGKRTGVYGSFLLACYDNESEEFQSICKIGTGFGDALLENISAKLKSKVIEKPKSYYRYSGKISPDVWFECSEVWEVKAADLTVSPEYSAAIGMVHSDKGISLRFPRLLRVRSDKNPEEASTSKMRADMYNAQKHAPNPVLKDAHDE